MSPQNETLPTVTPEKPRKKSAACPYCGGMRGSRGLVIRLLQLTELIREGKCPIIEELAQMFEVTTRTIERDFEFLRNQYRMEFSFDRARKVFRATTVMIPLPAMQITVPEIMALLIGRRAIQSHQGAGLYELATSAIEKITTFMSPEQAEAWKQMEKMISYCGVPGQGRIDASVFPLLSQALSDCEELELLYLKRGADAPEWRRVRPLHLYFRNNRWYLWAQDAARRFTGRRFALPRIQTVRPLGRHFERPADFDPDAVTADTVGIYGGGEPELIRLRLDREAARWLGESPLHASQRIERKPDGTHELTARIAITPELEGIILRWGIAVEVLEPQRLKDAVLATARALVERG